MSDKFNEVSSEAQRRAEKIKAIRKSIHGEAEVAPTTYENNTENEDSASISERIMRAKEKKEATAADILDELDAAIAYEKALAAKQAEEAAEDAERAAENVSPDISELIPELESPGHEELNEIAEQVAGDFAGASAPVTEDAEEIPENPGLPAEEEDLEKVFAVGSSDTEEETKVLPHIPSEGTADMPETEDAPVKVAADAVTQNTVEKAAAPEEPKPVLSAAADAAEDSGKAGHKKKKKKKSLKQRLIDLVPHKGDSIGECIRKVVFLCSIVAIVVCGYLVGDYYYDLWSSKRKTADIMKIYTESNDERPAAANDAPKDTRKKYTMLEGARKLYDINHDIVGVVEIPDTPLNNPVLQAEDNKKYLKMKYDLTENIAGEIFLDCRNHFDDVGEDGYLKYPNSDNLVLYGHDMYDDQMFGFLKYYVRNEAYYGLHPVINLSSNYEKYQYKIFAFFLLDASDDTDTKFECWNDLDFADEDDFYRFVNEAKRRTIRTNDVDVEYGDQLLTLSTCSTYFDDDRGRLIILARRVRDGEDPLKGTQDSKPNPNIKWPTIYYQYYPNEHYDPDAAFVPYGPKRGK